jgi:PHP family Zn ribbon phosphoesterase
MGVRHRIDDLSDRPEGRESPFRIPSRHLVPLEEIIREAFGLGPGATSVEKLYFRFIREMGNEHAILTEVPAAELRRIKPERIARGIERIRESRVRIMPGYDGVYGRVRILGRQPRLDNGKP